MNQIHWKSLLVHCLRKRRQFDLADGAHTNQITAASTLILPLITIRLLIYSLKKMRYKQAGLVADLWQDL